VKFGAHMSISGGLYKAFGHGEKAGCDTIQIFSKNQKQWQAKPLVDEDIAQFRAEQQRTGMGPLVVHDSYLINLAAPGDEIWNKSIAAFTQELERCAALGIPYEHLARLIELVEHDERIGICVDTCHILAAGYDIRTPEAYAQTMAEFDRIIGLDRIKCFHLNDSQKGLGSKVDRHAHIGQGEVGLEGFRSVVNDARFAGLPMILETPKEEDLAEDIANLATLRGLIAV
jgi:deoxyribonuclease IV